MSILKVTRLGHPVLRQVAAAVSLEDLKTPTRQKFIDEVVENPRYPDKPKVPLTVLVNPRITPTSDEMEDDWEGCLSIPDLRGLVPRYKSIRVRAHDRFGQPLDFVAHDFHARVIQHE